MKIKYIKDAPNGPAGMLDEVTEFEGNVLVLTGFAVVDEGIETKPSAEPKTKAKSKTKATTKTDNE
ncbi:hypothetical protein [Psychrobacter alimentarius]|uniref:hypothetical protein n=1 Tax=Psychrobacter alimentarius TaxID=261164 RepID=UPI003FD5862C